MNYYDEDWARRMRLQQDGYRFCHNRSARKHRRQGHHVMWAGEGWYAWKDDREPQGGNG